MLIVSYDITNNKKRSRFSKFLKKFGSRLQYSVFELRNSQRVLQNIVSEVECKYRQKFELTDSVYIMQLCEGCKKKVKRYGAAAHQDKEVVCLTDLWKFCEFYNKVEVPMQVLQNWQNLGLYIATSPIISQKVIFALCKICIFLAYYRHIQSQIPL